MGRTTQELGLHVEAIALMPYVEVQTSIAAVLDPAEAEVIDPIGESVVDIVVGVAQVLGVHASLVLREPWRHRQIGDGMPVTSDDIRLVDEVFGVGLGELTELVAPVHRIEDAVVLIVALPDIKAEGYVA